MVAGQTLLTGGTLFKQRCSTDRMIASAMSSPDMSCDEGRAAAHEILPDRRLPCRHVCGESQMARQVCPSIPRSSRSRSFVSFAMGGPAKFLRTPAPYQMVSRTASKPAITYTTFWFGGWMPT
ncbi:hypothetical protein LMG24235_04418 [Paraburkholderia sabiae]|nr:hypothetical protein LMG24235_04418 [Paraburkholderia sabiae]